MPCRPRYAACPLLCQGGADGGDTDAFKTQYSLVFSITLHNIPEGLAVGVAFGAAAASGDHTSLLAAMAVALGIGLQNFRKARRYRFR